MNRLQFMAQTFRKLQVDNAESAKREKGYPSEDYFEGKADAYEIAAGTLESLAKDFPNYEE